MKCSNRGAIGQQDRNDGCRLKSEHSKEMRYEGKRKRRRKRNEER